MTIPFLSSLQKKFTSSSTGKGPQPQRDWVIIATIGLVGLLLSAGWSYWSALTTQPPTTVSVGKGGDLKTGSLDTVRTIFEKRAAERVRYQNEYHFVDPSR
jgi:hypothetical protein